MIRFPRVGVYAHTAQLQATNSARLGAAEEQAATGRRLNRPSDAPADLPEMHHLDAALADQDVWAQNAEAAGSMLTSMDGALGQANDLIVRARELAVAMSSETATQEGRAAAAIEVRSLQASMVATANTKFGGRYVFGGDSFEAPPFDTTGAYSGSTAEPATQVAEAQWIRTGFDGSAVFDGSVDVFGTLEALAVALEANDPSAVQATLPGLDDSTSALSAARGEVGVETLAAEDAITNSESLRALCENRLSQLVSVDPAQAYSTLTELRNTYDATLQVAASAGNRSLLDYLE